MYHVCMSSLLFSCYYSMHIYLFICNSYALSVYQVMNVWHWQIYCLLIIHRCSRRHLISHIKRDFFMQLSKLRCGFCTNQLVLQLATNFRGNHTMTMQRRYKFHQFCPQWICSLFGYWCTANCHSHLLLQFLTT